MSDQLKTMKLLIPPIRIADHFNLSIILLVLGFIIACLLLLYYYLLIYYIRYVVTYNKRERSLTREILFAGFSSVYLGLGSFLLMLNFGLNV